MTIGDNVWLGTHGGDQRRHDRERAVIGANSVVTSDIAPNSIATGASAAVRTTIAH